MKDLHSGNDPQSEMSPIDSLSQQGDASEAQQKTMDAIVTNLDAINTNITSMSTAIAAITATSGNASLSTTNSYLACIQDSVQALVSTGQNGDTGTTVDIGATESTLAALASTVVDIKASLDQLLATNALTFKVEGNTDALQNVSKVIALLTDTKHGKQMQDNAKNIGKALETIAPGIQGIAEALMVTDEQKANGDVLKHSLDTGLLGVIKAFIGIMVDKDRLEQMKDNANVFHTVLVSVADTLDDAMSKIHPTEANQKALEALGQFVEGLNGILRDAAILTATLGVVTVGVAYAFQYLDAATIAKASIGFPAVALGISAGVLAITKAANDIDTAKIHNVATSVAIIGGALAVLSLIPANQLVKAAGAMILASTILAVGLMTVNKLAGKEVAEFGKNISYFALGVATMGLALYALGYIFETTPWSIIAKGALVMLATGAVLAVALAIVPTKTIANFGWSVLALTASILVLGYALPYFEEQTKDLEWETWAKAGAVLLALAGSVALANSTMKEGSGTSVAVSILAMVGALAAIPYVLNLYKDVTWESMAMPGAVLATIVGAVVLVGQFGPTTYAGVLAIVAVCGAVTMMAYMLPKFETITWETLGKAAAAVTGLGAALYAVGAGSAITLLGAAALVAGAGAIMLLGAGLSRWPVQITLEQYGTMAAGMATVAASLALIGNPITLAFVLAGTAAAASVGAALYALGKGLQQTATLDFNAATTAADAVMTWASDTVQKIANNMSLKDIVKAKLALSPIYDLGTALKNVVDAVIAMANGTYNEYEVGQDGKPKIVAVKHIGPETYAAFAQSLTQMISGITEPLAKFGSGGGWLTKSDTAKGIDALKDIGSIIEPMINVAKNIDAIKAADFSIIGPRFRAFFGVDDKGEVLNNGLISVLQGIGKTDDSWFSESDLENGIEAMADIDKIVKPFCELAKNAETIKNADFKAFGNGLTDLIPSIKTFSDFDTTLPDNFKIATNLKSVTDSFVNLDKHKDNLSLMKDIAVSIDSIANTDISRLQKVKSEATKQLFAKLDAMTKQLEKIEDNTSPDNQVSQTDIAMNPDGTPKQSFQLQAGQHVDIVTIAVQLNQIKNILAAQRTTPKS